MRLLIAALMVIVLPLLAKELEYNEGEALALWGTVTAREEEGPPPLTLADALERAFNANPTLAATLWQFREQEANVIQQKLVPNPNFEVDFDNFAGSNFFNGVDAASVEFSLSKTVETSWKRLRRTVVARQQAELKRWSYLSQAVDTCNAVVNGYIDLIVAQAEVPLREELLELAQEVVSANKEDDKSTTTLGLERARARVVVVQSRVELEQARTNLVLARQRLAATWGSADTSDFGPAIGLLVPLPDLPDLEELMPLILHNPDVARFDAARREAAAQINHQRARSIPDIDLSGHVYFFNSTNDYAFSAGLSVDIPVCNRNQGNILKAIYSASEVEERYRETCIDVAYKLEESQEQLRLFIIQSKLYLEEAIPIARDAFFAAQSRFKGGSLSYLTLLNAQQTLTNAELSCLKVLGEAHKSRANIDRYIGACVGRYVEYVEKH